MLKSADDRLGDGRWVVVDGGVVDDIPADDRVLHVELLPALPWRCGDPFVARPHPLAIRAEHGVGHALTERCLLTKSSVYLNWTIYLRQIYLTCLGKEISMTSDGGLIHWQAKLGMAMVGIGAIGLFLTTQSTLPNEGVLPFVLILSALLGSLMLFLSVGVENTTTDLGQTSQLVPDELVDVVDSIIGKEEEE